jgi:hypothetical protein
MDELLQDIHKDIKNKINQFVQCNINNLKLWLFKYRKEIDSLKHWYIYPRPTDEIEKLLKKTEIRGGAGTIGFVLRAKKSEFVNNTFDDPRGTVALEDRLLENFSWFGIPVLDKSGEVKVIVSFFFPDYNAFNYKKKGTIINNVYIEEEHQKMLLWHYEKDKLEEIIQELTKSPVIEKEKDEISWAIEEIQKFLYSVYRVSTIFIFTKGSNGRYYIPSENYIGLDIKNLEDALLKEIQWCFYFYLPNQLQGKCINCPLKNYFNHSNNIKWNSVQLNNDCFILNFYNIISPFYEYLTEIARDNNKGSFFVTFATKDNEWKPDNSVKKGLGYLEIFLNTYWKVDSNFEKKKIVFDLATSIFKIFANRIMERNVKSIREELNPYEEVAKEMFNNLKNSLDEKRNSFIEFLNRICKDANFRDNLFFISFWLKEKNGYLLKIYVEEGNLPDYFKEPSNLKPIYRAISQNDDKIIQMYSPLTKIEFDCVFNESEKKIEFKKRENCVIRINWEENKEKLTPLAVRFNPYTIKKRYFEKVATKEETDLRESKGRKILHIECARKIALDNENILVLGLPSDIKEEFYNNIIIDYAKKIFKIAKVEIEHKNVFEYALRSAVAAIMARNMSHNIGSHVLSHFIANIEGNIKDSHQLQKELLSYLKARMDFIAEISTYWRQLPWLNQ